MKSKSILHNFYRLWFVKYAKIANKTFNNNLTYPLPKVKNKVINIVASPIAALIVDTKNTIVKLPLVTERNI